MAAKKETAKITSKFSLVDRFEGTIVEKPIVLANKTVLAGLGLATRLQNDFEAKFDEFAQDGAKVRSEAVKSASELRTDIESRIGTARKNLGKRVETAVEVVLDYAPIATTDDVAKLNKKLDKVLVSIAK